MISLQSQCDRLLALLRSKKWVTLPQILDLRIASHSRRISDLRKQRYWIECEITVVDGQRHSRYRLIATPDEIESWAEPELREGGGNGKE
jgi:hypothetical protein